MATIIPFSPNPTGPVQFQATLDGTSYNIAVPWNVYRQGWYIQVTDASGNLIVTVPRIGSPPNYDINILGGYFTSTLIWRPAFQQFEVSP